MRSGILLAAVVLSLVQIRATAAPFEIDFIETDELLLIYQDPFQTYLVPTSPRVFTIPSSFKSIFLTGIPAKERA